MTWPANLRPWDAQVTLPPGAAARYPDPGYSDPASSLNANPFVAGKPVYRTLAEHQQGEEEWPLHAVAERLHALWALLDAEFGVRIPPAPLRLAANLTRNCLGYYRRSHNDFGLENEIAVGLPAAPDGRVPARLLDWGQLTGTLLHEMLHFKQALYGRPGRDNYHNAAYQAMARECGLIVNGRGYQTYEPRGRFLMFLASHGIPWPRVAAAPTPVKPPKPAPSRGSKLRLWVCDCPVRARVAVPRFNVRCLDCGGLFRRAD